MHEVLSFLLWRVIFKLILLAHCFRLPIDEKIREDFCPFCPFAVLEDIC
jgi:hypothetical protein